MKKAFLFLYVSLISYVFETRAEPSQECLSAQEKVQKLKQDIIPVEASLKASKEAYSECYSLSGGVSSRCRKESLARSEASQEHEKHTQELKTLEKNATLLCAGVPLPQDPAHSEKKKTLSTEELPWQLYKNSVSLALFGPTGLAGVQASRWFLPQFSVLAGVGFPSLYAGIHGEFLEGHVRLFVSITGGVMYPRALKKGVQTVTFALSADDTLPEPKRINFVALNHGVRYAFTRRLSASAFASVFYLFYKKDTQPWFGMTLDWFY